MTRLRALLDAKRCTSVLTILHVDAILCAFLYGKDGGVTALVSTERVGKKERTDQEKVRKENSLRACFTR